MVKFNQKPKRLLIIFVNFVSFARLVIILCTSKQLSSIAGLTKYWNLPLLGSLHNLVCCDCHFIDLKNWKGLTEKSGWQWYQQKKEGGGRLLLSQNHSPNVSKCVFTEWWGLSRTLIIISWVCFLDELFPHAVSSRNERKSLFLLCLHHNDGSFFSCASYLFLTTCKAASLPQSFSAVSPPLILFPSPTLSHSLCVVPGRATVY